MWTDLHWHQEARMKILHLLHSVRYLIHLQVSCPGIISTSYMWANPSHSYDQINLSMYGGYTIVDFKYVKKIHTVPKIFCDSSNVKKLNFSCYKTPIFQFQVEIAISLILNLSPWTLIIKFILLTNIVFFVIKTDYQDELSGAALLREILAYECPQQVSCSLKVVMVMMRMMMVTMMVRYFYFKQDGSTPPSPSFRVICWQSNCLRFDLTFSQYSTVV